MTKDQLDGLKGAFELSEKLDKVLNKNDPGALTESRVQEVIIKYVNPRDRYCTMSIEPDDERITISSSLQGAININEQKRIALAALAHMISAALISALKEEHEEIKATIESWEIKQ